MKTYDVVLSGVQVVNDDKGPRHLSRTIEAVLRTHGVHVNSIKITERDH